MWISLALTFPKEKLLSVNCGLSRLIFNGTYQLLFHSCYILKHKAMFPIEELVTMELSQG